MQQNTDIWNRYISRLIDLSRCGNSYKQDMFRVDMIRLTRLVATWSHEHILGKFYFQHSDTLKVVKEGRKKQTASSIRKPFVQLIRVPDANDNCRTGKEKVKPSSLCLPGGRWKSSPSVATNFASASAMKSNSSWIKKEHQLMEIIKVSISSHENVLTLHELVISCGGIDTSSNSCLIGLSLPPNWTRITRKFVPPRSNA